MDDERILAVLPDAVHQAAPPPAPDWLFGGPPRPEERHGLIHDARLRYDLVVSDRRLIVVPVTEGKPRDREAGYRVAAPATIVATVPGCRSVWPADVGEVVIDRLLVAASDYASDWGTDVILRSALGGQTRFRAINVPLTADEVVRLLEPAFGEHVRRARTVRHGLLRRATRE